MHFDAFQLNFDNWWIIRRRQVSTGEDVIMNLPDSFVCSITMCDNFQYGNDCELCGNKCVW
jgi:hypothetical protein